MQEETNISSNKSQRPTIDEQMTIIVKEIISKHGCNYEISRKDLIDKVVASFKKIGITIDEASIIPADFCYNRVNKGINFDTKPRLLKFLGNGHYECLGKNYKFTGKVYTNPKGESKEIVVGSWKDGKLKKNENWNKQDLK